MRFLLRLILAVAMAALLAGVCFKSAKAAGEGARATQASAGVTFEDVARAAGINSHLTCGGPQKRYIMESMCGGVAVFDYDNDGWMDILLVDGSTLADLRAERCHHVALYRNNHNGTFSDVSAKAGLNHCGWGFGVAVGDYDNDGYEDVYITYLDGGEIGRASCRERV